MNQSELAADVLGRNFEMLKMTLADFSDADILVRPCPGANHAAWQLGHLIVAETQLMGGLKPGAFPALPDGFDKKFTKETSGKDDAASFPKKAELLDLLGKVRAATISAVKGLSPADFDKPAPEPIRSFAPTMGHLISLDSAHVAMHMGQFQVIRRKLGKPVLF